MQNSELISRINAELAEGNRVQIEYDKTNKNYRIAVMEIEKYEEGNNDN